MKPVALLAVAALAFAAPARAQDAIADFYRGKQITIVVGSTAGGGYDLYARLVARHIGKYIPGNPNVVVQNMPGASGNTSAAFVANVAAKDGTYIGAPQAGSLVDQLISQNAAQIKHDARTLNYIGSANSEMFTCIVAADAPIRTFDDIFQREVILGSSGGTTRDMPMALKNVLHAKFKMVAGYPGTKEITLAFQRNEIQAICGFGYSSLMSQYPDWVPTGAARVFVQESTQGHPDLNKLGIPLAATFAPTDEDRQIGRAHV